MSITDVFRVNQIKAELSQATQERDDLRRLLAETNRLDLHDIQAQIGKLHAERDQAQAALEDLRFRSVKEHQQLQADFEKRKAGYQQQAADLERQLAERRANLVTMDEELLLQSFGFYQTRYNLGSSEIYKNKIDDIRARQATMVKAGTAAVCPTGWRVNNSEKEGERMIKDYLKLIVRSFNNECDASIVGVKFSNVDSIEKRIRKAYDTLNQLAKRMNITLMPDYLGLKLEELYLCHEYQIQKQKEKEEDKQRRERLREEARLAREIEDMKLKVEKEEKHFAKAIEENARQLAFATTESERQLLLDEQHKLQAKLVEVERVKKDVLNREQNTRAGYVYVISNIGSFGEGVFKIGVTRRLDPTERVWELGDASVPFDFDIHAMIFSDDAPALESALHKAFAKDRLNWVNARREFFRANLDEIENVVRQNFSKPVEINRLAEAEEYRESLVLRQTALSPNVPVTASAV